MKTSAILFTTLCFIFQLTATAQIPQLNGDYSRHIFEDSINTAMPYRMLSPEKMAEGEKYPLILFLHGSGERGNDNESQLTNGASVFSNPMNAEKYPAFVVFPQCTDKTWTGRIDENSFVPGAATPEESPTEKMLMSLVDNLVDNNPIDTDRIYIIGISMGGIAAYDLVCRYPEKFAAAVPICGAINPDRLTGAKDVKFLIFHGEIDDEIPAICSRAAYKTLKSAGSDVDYIELACVGHECWPWAFNYPDLLPWLFAKSKNRDTTTDISLTYLKE